MGLKKRVIAIMKEKLDLFNQSEELRDIAMKRMVGKKTIDSEKLEQYDVV